MRARLFLQICSIEARRRMSYRVDFWLTSVVSFGAEFGVIYFLWTAMFREAETTTIASYSLDGMVLYYVAVILLSKIVRGVTFDNYIAQDIYEGSLNRYLIFPSSYLGFKYAQHLGSLLPALFQVALFGGLCVFLLDIPSDVEITPLTILMCVAATVMANLLYFLMSVTLQSIAFWADNVWSLNVALRFIGGLLGGAMVPLTLFPDAARTALTYTPFPFLFAAPVEALLGRMTVAQWGTSLLLAGVWILVVGAIGRSVWRRGDLQYSGVGI